MYINIIKCYFLKIKYYYINMIKRIVVAFCIFSLTFSVFSEIKGDIKAAQEIEISQADKKKIKNILFNKYAAKKDLSQEEFDEIETIADLSFFLERNVKENHLKFLWGEKDNIKLSVSYVVERPNLKSLTSENKTYHTYFQTENTEYVRISREITVDSCHSTRKITGNKDFVIFDLRNNGGGVQGPIGECLLKLIKKSYKGKVIFLVDSYSGSAAEGGFWQNHRLIKGKLDVLTAGQDTYGCIAYAWMKTIKVNDFWFIIPTHINIDNEFYNNEYFKGEGLGFSPDIYVENIDDIIPTLNSLGVILDGIEIR